MAIETALETPVHLQWDPDSRLPSPDPGSAPNNCGPTSVANIAHFYRENHIGVYNTRRLAVTDPTRATTVGEQKIMLEKRGVSCYIGQPILSQIRDYVARGRRPLVLGLFMEKVPYLVAGHNFRGWHAVEVLGLHGSDSVLVRAPKNGEPSRLPRCKLHGAHAALRLSAISLPPLERGTMWSTTVATPTHRSPRIWHSHPSRSST